MVIIGELQTGTVVLGIAKAIMHCFWSLKVTYSLNIMVDLRLFQLEPVAYYLQHVALTFFSQGCSLS